MPRFLNIIFLGTGLWMAVGLAMFFLPTSIDRLLFPPLFVLGLFSIPACVVYGIVLLYRKGISNADNE
jgi:uncharacterized membrane-anchored protein